MLTDKNTCNWIKGSFALSLTKQGLEKFVDSGIQKVRAIVGKGCGQCHIENLLHCPTPGICRKAQTCCFHRTPDLHRRPCPAGLCDQVKVNIASYHRYPKPSWKNTKAELWATDHWEVAKCFLPPDGYFHVSSVHETDFNGVISILLNCTHFDLFFSFTIAPPLPAPECTLTKARQLGRKIRHTPSCKVTESDLNDCIQTLLSILSDPTYLSTVGDATSVSIKLKELLNSPSFITPEHFHEHLKEAQQMLVELKRSEETLLKENERLSETVEEINIHQKTCLQRIDQKAREVEEHVAQMDEKSIQVIEIKIKASLKSLEEKSKKFRDNHLNEIKQAREEITIYTRQCINVLEASFEEQKKELETKTFESNQSIVWKRMDEKNDGIILFKKHNQEKYSCYNPLLMYIKKLANSLRGLFKTK